MIEVKVSGVGGNSSTEMQVDPSFQSIRANIKPLEFTGYGFIGGHFFMAGTFLSTAAALTAGSQIFAVRWADSSRLFVLKRLVMSVGLSTAFTSAQVCDYDAIVARSFSTNPSGGTSITLATTAQKARSATMSGSLLATSGGIVISSGGPLSPGTETLDTQPFGYGVALVQSAAAANATGVQTPGIVPLYELRDFGQHPIILAANEGFAIRNVTGHGAAGVVRHGFMMEWAEVASY